MCHWNQHTRVVTIFFLSPAEYQFLFTLLLNLFKRELLCVLSKKWSYISSSSSQVTWGPFQYPIRHLIVRSRKVLKLQDLYLELYDRSEIWQAPRQQCYRIACHISKWCNNFNCQSRGFETSQDLTTRRLIRYWNGALDDITNNSSSVKVCGKDIQNTVKSLI